VESSEFGIEPSGSINPGKLSSVLITSDLSSCAQLHRVKRLTVGFLFLFMFKLLSRQTLLSNKKYRKQSALTFKILVSTGA
jgi:hypothetical protein